MTDPVVNAVRLLHHPDPHIDKRWCAECGKWWPCPTASIIDRAAAAP